MGRPSLKWRSVCTSTVGLLCVPDIVMIKVDINPYEICCALEDRTAWRIPSCDMTYLDKYKEGMHGEPQEYPFGGAIFKVVYWEEFLRLAEGLSLMKVLLIYWSEILKSNSYGVVFFLCRFWYLYVYCVWLSFCVERGSWSVSQTGCGLLILPYVFFLLLPLQLNCMSLDKQVFFIIFLELFVNINYR